MGLIKRAIKHPYGKNNFDFEFATNSINRKYKFNCDDLALKSPVQFIFKYTNVKTIDFAMKLNPQICKILDENKLPYEYNIENVTSIIASHLLPTARTAKKMYFNCSEIQDENYLFLMQAALLHDIGKVFIPSKILNKTGRLTLKERLIVQLHNELGCEILKTVKLDPKVAKLTFEHHDYEGKLTRTKENQILTISDIYCALKEQRSYKRALDDITARTILYDMGAKNKFDIGYVKYLC